MTTMAPALLLVSSRPDQTSSMMVPIRSARPPCLYVAADGSRERPGEEQRLPEIWGLGLLTAIG
jgi:hypothetical protein